MRTLGLIGGLSWTSTLEYYRIINETVGRTLGGHHSAKLNLVSLDFSEIVMLQKKGDWEACGAVLAKAAQNLENAGAECIVICSNTMHKVAPAVQMNCSLPLLHVAQSVGCVLQKNLNRRVGILGTLFTMRQSFYRDALAPFGCEMVMPDERFAKAINELIFKELTQGIHSDAAEQSFANAVHNLVQKGCDSVLLACTELMLLSGARKTFEVPLYDSTSIHAEYAAHWSQGLFNLE